MAPREAPHSPRNWSAAHYPPPEEKQKGTAGAVLMIVPGEMILSPTAAPTSPRSGILSDGPKGVPPATRPPPLEAATAPPPGGTAAPAVARPNVPPREAMGGRTTVTGARVGLLAQIPPGACL